MINKKLAVIVAATGLSVMLSAVLSTAAMATEKSSSASSALPDWSGWWVSQGFSPNSKQLAAENPYDATAVSRSFKLERKAAFEKVIGEFFSGEDLNAKYGVSANAYCLPFRFIGYGLLHAWDPEAETEILFTPGRVTITDESGRLRRIWLAGQKIADFGETNTGVSVGHWEGQTLVVETRGLSRDGRYSWVPGAGGATIGENARISERIFLKRKDVLQVETVVDAPEAFTEPFKQTLLYERDPDHAFHEFSYCNEYDREIDPKTGHQRLDLTPPADLPPPPSD